MKFKILKSTSVMLSIH